MFGECNRCYVPWKIGVNEHTTPYKGSCGCFALCEACWTLLSPGERVPYYKKLHEDWMSLGYPTMNGVTWDQVWLRIEAAVLGGG